MKNNGNGTSGKGHRVALMVLAVFVAVLVATNAITAYLWQKTALTTSDVVNGKYDLLNPARKFFNQEDLIVNFQQLRDDLDDQYKDNQNVSMYFEYLPTGANIAMNKDAEFYPASLLKVPVAMAVAKKVEKGEWKWSNKLVLMATDKDETFGAMYKDPTNGTYTIEELVKRSLSESDNTAHFILLRNLDTSEVADAYEHIGLNDYLNSNGNLSAKRYSVIMRALYNVSYLNEENSQKLLTYLARSPFNEYLGSGIPDDIRFAHKIGESVNQKVLSDSGVVYYNGRPYILTVMIKNTPREDSLRIMKDISEKSFAYVKNYKE